MISGKVGDTFRLVDLDGVFVLTSPVSDLAREIERVQQEAGLTMEELLQALREQRARRQLAKKRVAAIIKSYVIQMEKQQLGRSRGRARRLSALELT